MRWVLRIVGGILGSAFLLYLALPPINQGFLGWVALVPILLGIRQTRFSVGFLSGILIGVLMAVFAAAGIANASTHVGTSADWIYAGFTLFGLVLGAGLGVFAAAKRFTWRECVFIPAWAVLFEACSLVGFPMHIGLTQHQNFVPLLLASVGGIWLVSYVVWLVNIVLTWLIITPQNEVPRKALGAWAALGFVGGHSIPAPLAKDAALGKRIAVIQTNSVDTKGLTMLHATAAYGSDLVIWPESAGGAFVTAGDTSELARLSESTPFITSFSDKSQPLPFNTACLFADGAEQPARYHKRKPFAGEINFHQPGKKAAKTRWQELNIGLNICFDSCYPAVMRDTALLEGVNLIALPTLDPDTPFGVIQAIHAAYTPFRCAELGVPIVRADTTAYSALYLPFTRPRFADPAQDGSAMKVYKVDRRRIGPMYLALGDWWLWICGSLALFGIALRDRSKDKSTVVTEEPTLP